jgi:hypothetical protein
LSIAMAFTRNKDMPRLFIGFKRLKLVNWKCQGHLWKLVHLNVWRKNIMYFNFVAIYCLPIIQMFLVALAF